MPATPAEAAARDHVSVLRLEAQKLAHDARKPARQQNGIEEPAASEVDQAEDMIESIALNLDAWLIHTENVQSAFTQTASTETKNTPAASIQTGAV